MLTWIVDSGTLKVYQYVGAASRTSGSQNAAATFALNPYDTNPQGIADPPPANMLLTPTRTVAPIAVPTVTPSTIPSLASRDVVFALLSSPTASPTLATERMMVLPSGAPIAPVPLTALVSESSPAVYLGGVTVVVAAGSSTDDNSLEAATDSIFAGLADDLISEE